MRNKLRQLGLSALALALAIPVALVATFLLTPIWRWIEATTGIESVGHSGPANWCFVVTYLLTLLGAFGIWFSLLGRARRP